MRREHSRDLVQHELGHACSWLKTAPTKVSAVIIEAHPEGGLCTRPVFFDGAQPELGDFTRSTAAGLIYGVGVDTDYDKDMLINLTGGDITAIKAALGWAMRHVPSLVKAYDDRALDAMIRRLENGHSVEIRNRLH